MNALDKKLLNSLKCPICRAPIDMLSWKDHKPFDFGCAYEADHYKIALNNGYIAKEHAAFYDKAHKYVIVKTYQDLFEKTEIFIYEADPEQRVSFTFATKKIATDLKLFDFRNFNVKNAINRIKTYLIFQ